MTASANVNDSSWSQIDMMSDDMATKRILRCSTPGASWSDSEQNLGHEDLTASNLKQLIDDLGKDPQSLPQDFSVHLGYQIPLLELCGEEETDAAFDPMDRIEQWVGIADLFLKLKSLIPDRCKILRLPHSEAFEADLNRTRSPEGLDPMLMLLVVSHPLAYRRYADLTTQTEISSEQTALHADPLLMYTESFRNICWRSWCEARQDRMNAQRDAERLDAANKKLEEADQTIKNQREALQRCGQTEETLRQQVDKHLNANKDGLLTITNLKAELDNLKELYRRLREKSKAMRRSINDLEGKSAEDIDKLFATQLELEEVFNGQKTLQALCKAQSEILRRAERIIQQLAEGHGIATDPPTPSIQVLALLEGYRHSLKRAERLLLRKV